MNSLPERPGSYVPDNHAYLPIQKDATLKKVPHVDTELIASGKKQQLSPSCLLWKTSWKREKYIKLWNGLLMGTGLLHLFFRPKGTIININIKTQLKGWCWSQVRDNQNVSRAIFLCYIAT